MAGQKLTLGVTVGYATAESGVNTVETILRLYLLAYYTNVVGLPLYETVSLLEGAGYPVFHSWMMAPPTEI